MQKILYLHAGAEMYGADKVLLELIKGLNKDEFEAHVILPNDGVLAGALESVGAKVKVIDYPILRRKYFNPKGILEYFGSYNRYSKKIAEYAKENGITLLHNNTTAVLEGIYLKRKLKLPLIWHVHEIIVKPKAISDFINFLMGRYADTIVTVSNAVANHVKQSRFVKNNQVQVIYNGVDNTVYHEMDAKSGTSGAGRGAKVPNLFCEVNENMKAYGVASHRHTPEIEEQLGYASGEKVLINFTPHLVPMNRGILATEYATLKKDVTYEEVKAIYDKYYKDEKFVRVLEKDVCPETKWVEGSNYVDINFKIDPRTNRIIMMGAIDNLVKGAAGQAVQNMNLMFGLPETEGLELVPMFP